MGGLTSAVQWWEESQMRVLVLGSLVVQFLLFIFTYLRTRAIPGWIRFMMWLAYLGGDAIAIYALATLFNRHKDQDPGGKNTLEVVWAPILLIHLGGHDGITAYNIEDNELWTRHLLTAVAQVTVAIYVFCKSWPPGGDRRLLQASILLFITGVLKCFGKPWALKVASIKSLVSSPAAQSSTKQTKEDMKLLEEYVQRRAEASAIQEQKKDEGEAQGQGAMTCVEDRDNPIPVPPQERGSGGIPPTQACPRRRRRQRQRDALHGKQNEVEKDTFERYVKGAIAFVREQKDEGEAQVYPGASVDGRDHLPSQQRDDISSSQVKGKERDILLGEACKLFVDLSSPYSLQLSIFKYFWTLSEERVEKAYGSVRQGLATAFILLYTKMKFTGIIFTRIIAQPDLRVSSAKNLVWENYTSFWRNLNKNSAFGLIKNSTFGEATKLLFGLLVMSSRLYLPGAAIGLFHYSHREDYSGIDVKITYALFCCTAALEVYSFGIFLVADAYKEQWPETVAQYNLTEYFVRNKNHSNMMWIASKSGCKDLLDQHWCMDSCFSSAAITELVLQYLKAGWKEKIHDPVSYHKFNDNRGQRALESYEDELGWSIKGPFDESVLLWHIATDFCFFLRTPTRSSCGEQPTSHKAVECRQMSNYMMYLLFVNPEMLLPGTRRNLFTVAYNDLKDILGYNKPSLFAAAYKELKDILKDDRQNVYRRVGNAMKELKDIFADNKRNPISRSQGNPEPVKEEGIIERVISSILDKSMKTSEGQESKQGSEDSESESESEDGHKEELEQGGSRQNRITDAWALAQGLLNLGDEKMWEVIQGVWVEMLCFSASRCRGYLHAKALGSGGEFLSYVWLLLFYMGMETFTERLQREELPNREANNNGAPRTSDAHNGNATADSSTSEVHIRVSPSVENDIFGEELV